MKNANRPTERRNSESKGDSKAFAVKIEEKSVEEKQIITFSKSKPKDTHNNNKSQFLEELDCEEYLLCTKSKFNKTI